MQKKHLAENQSQRRGRGKPRHEPTKETRRQIEMMVASGIQFELIAAIIGISEPTLRKYYPEELALGKAKANAMVAANIFRQATKDDPRCASFALFWAKTQMGWKETHIVENTHQFVERDSLDLET